MPYKYKGAPAPKRKAAASQARLKKSAAKSYTKAPSYGYKRTVGAAPTGKSKVVTGGAKFPTGSVSTPLSAGAAPLTGGKTRYPQVKVYKARKKSLTAAQQALVTGAMPKAKAQRSAQEIAAMHAYRAAGRPKPPSKKRRPGGTITGAIADEARPGQKPRKRNRKGGLGSMSGPVVGHALKDKPKKPRKKTSRRLYGPKDFR